MSYLPSLGFRRRERATRDKPPMIGLLDHLGGGNLGDDATQTAMMQNIRSRWPDAVICGFSMNPADTQARHSIAAYPIRRNIWANPERVGDAKQPARAWWDRPLLRRPLRILGQLIYGKPHAVLSEIAFLARSRRIIKSLDVFVISGGGQLLDSWGGPWAYPYTIFKWVALARLTGTKCYFANVGAGPLRHPLSRFFIRNALSLADYASFRDQESRSLVQAIGYHGPADVCHDSVYGLDVSRHRRGTGNPRNELVVGLSPMAYCDPRRYWKQEQTVYDAFVDKIVTFGASLCRDHRTVLFSTDIWFDLQTLERVDKELRLRVPGDRVQSIGRDSVDSLESLLSQMATMDFIVTCRFHGVVFAHLMGIPVIALSHHPKVTSLMVDLGMSEYCLDIETFSPQQLTGAFTRMVSNAREIRSRMSDKAASYKAELTAQFDRLFAAEAAR